ncbi:ABC-F family ATP-binding cassette domain-containing protein [Acetanaerobacterium elongatum]|uniref:ATP-binding cassette, subfamily F, uup n=1 Tax=Acetanaerobacterium elongatum TaxID=258515 RepID=A0A1H0BMH7_9FIRM|nr:ABC-F family ATP-binding cassette domain-containing protein [Acetanaerobacterium elongatum]SDN46663.1 ATP-binding cassette, subfamily F, uup [Acetanaerobacterium elongatum]
MLLSAEHISKNYGTKQLLQDVSLYLNEGNRFGIIGINGTGKSTLLKILAGAEQPDEGAIVMNPNIRVAYLPQTPEMSDGFTVLEQVFADFPAQFREIHEYEAKTMLTRLGIIDFDAKIGTLSGGQRKRVALAATLIHPADILILDEPTNHLDSEMVSWLEQYLCRLNGGLIMVTHDRYFLERVVNRIVELSHSKLYTYEANYSKYLELKAERAEMAEASERKRQSILRREYQWIMRGARARGTKSRDRIERYEALKEQTVQAADDTVQMSTVSTRLGRKTIELDRVTKALGGRTVIRDFSYIIAKGDRIGIVGKNGAGKSTLLNLIAGRLLPDEGTVDMGSTVKVGYFTQECRELDLNQRVYDFIREIAEDVKTPEGTFSASQMLERFLFTSDLQYSLIGRLSGGERRRLYLLSILMTAPNILLLDEPTNDLDIDTLVILEDYLLSFAGPVLTVSHDRYFLDKVATSIFEVNMEGNILQYTGNYTDYYEKRQITSLPAAKNEAAVKKEAPQKTTKLKFSFKEQREFDTIDDDIAALEAQIVQCEAEIASSASDYIRLQALMEQKAVLEAELDSKTERWVYLNELADKIAAQK